MIPVIRVPPRAAYSWLVAADRVAAAREASMVDASQSGDRKPPLGQRLLDRPFLLLVAGLVVMFGFYTVWGLVEVLSLPPAALP